MENLKTILNAKSRVFGNFQFSQYMARNHLVVHKLYSKFVIWNVPYTSLNSPSTHSDRTIPKFQHLW